jgi:hypothetical protein
MLHAKEDEAGRGSSLSCLLQYSIIACTYVEEDVVCACPLFFLGKPDLRYCAYYRVCMRSGVQSRVCMSREVYSVCALRFGDSWRGILGVEGGVKCMLHSLHT